ncbi:hypothetical protein CONPUDRAFT_81572, partial [Coniophora puteana RWD-64-598 SS2]
MASTTQTPMQENAQFERENEKDVGRREWDADTGHRRDSRKFLHQLCPAQSSMDVRLEEPRTYQKLPACGVGVGAVLVTVGSSLVALAFP